MSAVVQKLGLRLTRKHGIMIMRLYHKDNKAENIRLIANSWQKTISAEMKLPLPSNFKELPNSEMMVLSKERNRDVLGTYLAAFSSSKENSSDENDLIIGKYKNEGPVDLSSSMQTNVPEPFTARERPTHLHMPRGQWRQEAKYLSEQLHKYHYLNTRSLSSFIQSKRLFSSETKGSDSNINVKSEGPESSGQAEKLTRRQRLQAAVKEYGTTIMALHIGLSLVSLGACYFLIRSGVNLKEILKEQGITDGAGIVTSAGPFLVAYAVHKTLAPFRIGLTLTITPFLVNFLRKRGFKIKGK